MSGTKEDDLEVIFDPISKGAVVRRGIDLTYLDGPFPTLRDALAAARAHLAGPSLRTPRT